MDVLITGAGGTVGTAITDNLAGRTYDFTLLDREDESDRETVVADVADYEAIRPAFEGQDAVVHLAGYPATDATWPQTLENNVIGTYNVLEAAADAGVSTFVFASSNHAVGMFEAEHAPAIYEPEFELTVDHTAPVRPDSYYGASKAIGEDLGRYYLENREFPAACYALRICSVRDPEYDHPYGDAERGVDQGRWERASERYERQVARMKAMWQSRRDLAHMVDRCLRTGRRATDEPADGDADGRDPWDLEATIPFEVLYGVSDNDGRWFDIEHAREVVGYDPQDNGETWNAPPE